MDRPHAGPSEIARTFLKIGAMSYGGPAIMGIMQAEIQEKRQWIDKTRFVEGLALVNMLPGPGATQLGIFIGHAMAGTVGGILAGVCFIAPAFFIMLALAFAYETWGALPAIRSAFYGIGPVVLGVFALAVYRLGRNAVRDKSQIAIAVAAATAMVVSPLGIIMTLMLAGCAGIAFYDSRRDALVAAAIVLVGIAIAWGFDAAQVFAGIASPDTGRSRAGLADVGVFFFKVGAFTFGGGLSMLAFIEDQVVNQLGWLTHREFVDGLALGQLTPGPILMLAAFVGFKLHGVSGAAIAAGAIFLPSFLMMLTVLPLLRRMNELRWLRAFMRGVGPAVIGTLAVSLAEMAPHAAPDWPAWFLLGGTVVLLHWRSIGPLPMMIGGGAIGLALKGGPLDRLREL